MENWHSIQASVRRVFLRVWFLFVSRSVQLCNRITKKWLSTLATVQRKFSPTKFLFVLPPAQLMASVSSKAQKPSHSMKIFSLEEIIWLILCQQVSPRLQTMKIRLVCHVVEWAQYSAVQRQSSSKLLLRLFSWCLSASEFVSAFSCFRLCLIQRCPCRLPWIVNTGAVAEVPPCYATWRLILQLWPCCHVTQPYTSTIAQASDSPNWASSFKSFQSVTSLIVLSILSNYVRHRCSPSSPLALIM